MSDYFCVSGAVLASVRESSARVVRRAIPFDGGFGMRRASVGGYEEGDLGAYECERASGIG